LLKRKVTLWYYNAYVSALCVLNQCDFFSKLGRLIVMPVEATPPLYILICYNQ